MRACGLSREELNLKRLKLNFRKNKNLYKGLGLTKIKKINALFGVPYCNALKRTLINNIFNQEEEISQKELRESNINVYIENRCSRGLKHFKNLPVNGQRNRTNAKTRKKFNIY